MLREYREVPLELEKSGKISHDQIKILITGIAVFVMNAKIAKPRKKISICRDVEDNMILECCYSAGADYLITGDKDLLEIDQHQLSEARLKRLKILSPREFYTKFK